MIYYLLFGLGVYLGLMAGEIEKLKKDKRSKFKNYLVGFILTIVFPFFPLWVRFRGGSR